MSDSPDERSDNVPVLSSRPGQTVAKAGQSEDGLPQLAGAASINVVARGDKVEFPPTG